MHILLIHQAFATLSEAGGTRHIEMAYYLAERGHRITVIASPVSYLTGKTRSAGQPRGRVETFAEGITVIRPAVYGGIHRSFFHRLLSFFSFMVASFLAGLRVGPVDVVWGTSPPIFQAVTAWLLARRRRAAFLLEVRDLWPDFAVAAGVLRSLPLIAASRWLERLLYRKADRVMVNSPGFVNHVLQRGARWVELVPNGADPEMFDPDSDGSVFRRQHNLQDRCVVLYAGAHGLSNDLGVVLQAAAELGGMPQVVFALVGDGKEKPALQSRAQSLGLENVRFLPPLAKNQMPAAVAAADMCLAILKPLDLYRTTYPNKVFDYMAAGRPVVLAIDGVIRAVVEQAGAGVFVPPGDGHALAQAVSALAADPQARRQMGNSGRQAVVENFSRKRLAEQFLLLLEDLTRKDK